LAIVSVAVLIYFIHHASNIIQASNVISEVSTELDRAIERLFPEKLGRSVSQSHQHVAEIPVDFDSQACPIPANSNGYLQLIDDEQLMKLACKHKLLLCLKYRPGNFIVKGSNLVMAWPGERVNRKLSEQINDAFILGNERTQQQDVEFPINQLVEIALRAISPAVNDPFTAIRCIDRLNAGLCRLAQRDFPSPYRYDDDNNLRVIAQRVTFADLTDAAFNSIRQYSTKDVGVRIRLLEAIAEIARYTCNSKERAVLLHHAHLIDRGSSEGVLEEVDRKYIHERYQAVARALEQDERASATNIS
jgi:uncharacterized membrane protein